MQKGDAVPLGCKSSRRSGQENSVTVYTVKSFCTPYIMTSLSLYVFLNLGHDEIEHVMLVEMITTSAAFGDPSPWNLLDPNLDEPRLI